MVSSSCTISEKYNDPILRKFSDGRTYRGIDRRARVIYKTLPDQYRATNINTEKHH